ncbi:MAG: TRAP transporter small permease [Betaproteobacteria bacterium]
MRIESWLVGKVARIESWLLAGAIGCVFGLIVVTTADVVARYFLNRALGWAYDTSLVRLVGLCFLSIPSVAARREHVGMELIVQKFPPPLRLGAAILASLTGLFSFGLIGWKALEYAVEAAQSGWVYGGFGKIPTWLPYGVIATGSLLLSLRLALEALRVFRRRDGIERSSDLQG